MAQDDLPKHSRLEKKLGLCLYRVNAVGDCRRPGREHAQHAPRARTRAGRACGARRGAPDELHVRTSQPGSLQQRLQQRRPGHHKAAVLGLRDHEPAQQGPRTPAVLRQPTAAQLLPLARAGSLRHRISQVSALLQSPCQRPRYIGWETSRASPTQSSATTFRTPPRPRAAMTASSCAGAAG